MKNLRKEADNRYLLFLLLLIITICGVSYSRIRKKTILNFGTEKETQQSPSTIDVLKSITVEIEGEVNYPGMYTISEGYTLKDVIEKAGGLTEYAKDTVSLDWNVFDGQKIKIPKKEDNIEIEYSDLFLEQKEQEKQKEKTEQEEIEETEDIKKLYVNINTAEIEELILLPGIGEKIAQNIIEYRTANGPFQTIEEIKNVSKIGNSIFEKIKNYITIS